MGFGSDSTERFHFFEPAFGRWRLARRWQSGKQQPHVVLEVGRIDSAHDHR